MVITLANDNVRGGLGIYSVVALRVDFNKDGRRTSGDAHVAALEAVYSTVPQPWKGCSPDQCYEIENEFMS
jgi:hypothetical protein